MKEAREYQAELTIPVEGVAIQGSLQIPKNAQGVVLFAHGSGSSRKSPRNLFVARVLYESGLATLLFDLLTPEEAEEDAVQGNLRFDIGFLARRLSGVTDWMLRGAQTRALPVGYFGASTGAAAALVAASYQPEVRAIVSRGGRPDLAGRALPLVKAPTLLLVGGRDTEVISLNERAMAALTSVKKLQIVPGATHLFEEPGTLESVAHLAADWFLSYLPGKSATQRTIR